MLRKTESGLHPLYMLWRFIFTEKTIQVALGPQVKRDRVDNKELTPEEASELISHLTEEQKTMLLEVMEQKQKGRAEAPPR